MASRLHVGTRKGLFELVRRNGVWDVVEVQFLGDPVSAVLADGIPASCSYRVDSVPAMPMASCVPKMQVPPRAR